MKPVRWLGALIASLLVCALGVPAAEAWQPQPASYGVGSQTNFAVRAADGTVLRANVYYPTDRSGRAAPGPFPVILTQTPYGKDNGAFSGALGAGENDYLVKRGYIDVVADVRGTGGSQGEWGLFDPVQGHDGATLVSWAARLPHSDGKVGLFGPSYLGINQFATAVDAGPTHVKAMFPIISGNDLYRDTAFAGGFPDIEFSGLYLGMTAGLNLLLPAQEHNPDLAKALAEHVHDLSTFDAALVAGVETGGDQAYDQAYWGARNPVGLIEAIVRDRIPAFLVGGWYDLFQRGELLNYSGFQNAYVHRPVLAAMTPRQPVTPRYQLIQGPWYHVTAGMGLSYHGLDLPGVELAWFDHWLKGIDTGITDTSTPMHLEDLATGRYAEASRYPLDQAKPTTYYLRPSGGLATTAPPAAASSDPLVFTGTQVPCTSSTEQWAAGLGALAAVVLQAERSLHAECEPVPARAGHAELHDRPVQHAGHPGRSDRGHAICREHHGRQRMGSPTLRRRARRKRDRPDLRTARGQPAGPRCLAQLVCRRRQTAASLSPLHEGVPDPGNAGTGEPLRRRGVPHRRHARAGTSAARHCGDFGLPSRSAVGHAAAGSARRHLRIAAFRALSIER